MAKKSGGGDPKLGCPTNNVAPQKRRKKKEEDGSVIATPSNCLPFKKKKYGGRKITREKSS